MAHLVKCHLGMHINYSLIKQCYDKVLRFKTVFSASRCLSTTNFRTWSITMLHDEQNNMPSSTWNVPGGYFLVLSFAVMFTARCDRVFAFEEALGVLTTNLSMIMFVSAITKETTSCKRWSHCFCVDTYIENRVKYINNCEWSINTKDCLFFANEQSLSIKN